MADTIEINGKTYTVPEEKDFTFGDLEIIQESFGGDPPEQVNPRDVRMIKAMVRITLEHAGESITDEEFRKLPMTVLKQDEPRVEDDAVPPLVPAADLRRSEPAGGETMQNLASLPIASGNQS